MVLTHVAPKQVAGEDEKEKEMYKQYVYNPQPFLTVYFDQKHQHQLQFLQKNNESSQFNQERRSLTSRIELESAKQAKVSVSFQLQLQIER